ncbi:heavy metal translocating P-type ATPase [Candidatus Avelusimicrobium fimicolum]|uniref:heavy metal translocating P-type ATPase n=1 Tax=Candidatus Avelusimicrobium fimicolum TaxID=3416216 RepID=UPI003D0B565C
MSHHHESACTACHACSCAQGKEGESRGEWKKLALAAGLFSLGFFLPVPLAIKLPFYLTAYFISGIEVWQACYSNVKAGQWFDENSLMAVATLGAWCIGEFPEAVAVMLFYQVGELLQEYAAGKSRRSIVRLMDLRPDFARLIKSGKEEKVSPQTVKPGEVVLVLPGERVPLDGVIESGSGHLDTSALTGESRPVTAQSGQQVLAGVISVDGTLRVKVEKTYENSAVAKILELAENAASKKSSAEKFITRFARIYTPAVVFAAAAVAVLPPVILADASFKTWFYRALIFLVISCPCALVISVPLGFFGGIGGAARNGVLIKGSSYLEQLSRLYTLAFDKTGTLTQGVFAVTGLFPAGNTTEKELLKLAAAAERYSNHPVAKAILKEAETKTETPETVQEISGEGICASMKNTQILAGNERLMARYNVADVQTGRGTCVYVAENGFFKGRIELGDKVKPGTEEALKTLQNGLVHQVVMLSGDSISAAEKTAYELHIKHVYAGLLPADKVEILEKLISGTPNGLATAFVGDGINDAPVLARADLGIAMGALGSDAAIEAADVVLMTDEVKKIVSAIKISRKTLRVIKQNIVFALVIKAGVLALGAAGLANMWSAVFADVGVCLLAVANSLRPLYFKE